MKPPCRWRSAVVSTGWPRRDVADWLYARFLNDKAGTDTRFAAEIIDVSRGGMRVRLVDNGAVAFIPAPFLHAVRGRTGVQPGERYRADQR
ncbi:S1 RNA-binding domain-containing protein [Klebsiella pneumoniae subsp. pneumoniae]|nr:S1 RNA-binding domain-containing protein [Klebsiella pneumoniae subsp. pneumoniae]